MKKIAEAAMEMLASGVSFAQALVLESSGSTPREAGSAMLVRPDKTISGTIGGGVLEANTVNAAIKALADKRAAVAEFVLEEKGAAAIGAVCGGRAKVLIDYISADEPADMAFFEQLRRASSSNQLSHLAALIPASESLARRNICLVLPDGTLAGAEVFGPDILAQLRSGNSGYDVFTNLEQHAAYLFPVGSDGTVYIFGAGHCGEKLAHVVHTVGFETVVIDDRREFANAARLPEADDIIVPKKLDAPFDTLAFGPDSYIVIVTRGHIYDELVLRRALRTSAGYIGMIASRKKRDTIYRHLLDDGYTPDDIARVYSPIGIDISADTPEEIAVSITAELIKVRAARKRGG
ncbi:xanthine dehydrogenase accessory factor [Sporobacter termitidis DSM 10068]|uniref:Xanthine dehydrogenase accessory factor n=1 Tax=Sporobacter termitidis DSM 10068 TaxID=1123282 RepID=A0A1M5ZB33_9FIRM|nr:XdhC/CoxI family protein [Sporobacter termitidis]SHI21348.1 xanthine dehydrogenase accessory factor [Sporobacter termitidis DSM 10068]